MIERAYLRLCQVVGHAAIVVGAIVAMSMIYATYFIQ
jgi:hypothetical protein